MALKPLTREFTIPVGGVATLASILGMAENTWVGFVAMRAGRGNADDLFWQDENGQSGGYIGPGEAVTIEFGEGQTLVRNFSLSGTESDTVFMTIGVNRHYFPGDQ